MNADADFEAYKKFIHELVGHGQRAALEVWSAELTPDVQHRLVTALQLAKPMPQDRAQRMLARYLNTALYAELLRQVPEMLQVAADTPELASSENRRDIVAGLAADAGRAVARGLIADDNMQMGADIITWLTEVAG